MTMQGRGTCDTISRTTESQFLYKGPCPSCGSRDNLARYSDGHGYCFGCHYLEEGDGSESRRARVNNGEFITGDFKGLSKRGINEETCRKFGYAVGVGRTGQLVQIAPYHDEHGDLVAQHLRYANKDFSWLGEAKKGTLWGQHLWRDGGKQVVITEGEIDAMTISQLWGNKWPVVSIRSGASGAKKDIGKAVEWLEKFETVVMAFDTDEPGRKAAQECAIQLSPGRAKIWHIPLKDANEMLLAGREKELIDALWGAKVYRPDGIVSATETWDLLMQDETGENLPYPWGALNEKTRGLRLGEIVTLCAGSGVGKSQVCREIASDLMNRGERVGYIALEESVTRSIRGLVAIRVNRPLHIPEVRKTILEGELRAAWEGVKDRAYFYDHWGSTESDNLLNRIRYLARGCDCRWIILDHLSIVISGDGEGDERRKIDNTMTALRSLVEELNIGLLLVSHLKRPEGKGHEEGAPTSLSQLRGSHSISQLSDMVLGFERDQQDPENSNNMRVRVLKNRYTGETGLAGCLTYNRETGRLRELQMDCPFTAEGEINEPTNQDNVNAHY